MNPDPQFPRRISHPYTNQSDGNNLGTIKMTIGFSLVRSTKYQELMPDPFDTSSHAGFRTPIPTKAMATIWGRSK